MSSRDLVPRAERGMNSLPARFSDRDPFLSLQQRFHKLFNEFNELSPWSEGDELFNPRLNIIERESEFEITVEIPGIDEKDVEVTLTKDLLTIKGEKKQEEVKNTESYYRMERSYGSFCRTVQVPSNIVDSDNVEATFSNGVLKITFPKKEEVQEVSKRISVKSS